MAISDSQRRAFGSKLRQLRRHRNMVQADVARLMTAAGHEVKTQAVSGWERGVFAPQNRATAEALDTAVGAEGALLALLDYGPPSESTTGVSERLEKLESQLVEILVQLEELRRGQR